MSNVSDIMKQIVAIRDYEELRDIYRATHAHIQSVAQDLKWNFSKNDEVKFKDRKGNVLRGFVLKINSKNVKVSVPATDRFGQNMIWTVSPQLLEHV